jgi:hypothetical protein
MVFAVDPLVPRVWPHGTLASAGRLGRLHGHIIWTAAVLVGSRLREVLKDIY